jgi:hypothetical protein
MLSAIHNSFVRESAAHAKLMARARSRCHLKMVENSAASKHKRWVGKGINKCAIPEAGHRNKHITRHIAKSARHTSWT